MHISKTIFISMLEKESVLLHRAADRTLQCT